jgi:hypothetical protein
MRPSLLIACLLTFMAGTLWSQADEPQWLATVNGDLGNLAFSSEAEKVNILSAGLVLSSGYDDNAFSTSTNRVGNVSYQVSPSISITEARRRVFWVFSYNPGFYWTQRSSQRYSVSHDLDFNLQYRLAERLTARIRESYLDSSTAFTGINENSLLPGGNALHQPNQSVITPLAKQIANVTSLDLIDQIGEGTSVGVSGNFNKLNYHESGTISSASLFSNESWSASAFYNHSLSPRHSIGVTYSLQKIVTFGQIREHVDTHSVTLFYTLKPTSSTKLSFFAGPNRTTVNDKFILVFGPFLFPISLTHSTWLVDEGMTFGWQGQRNSAELNFIHHVTDGGGLTGAVQLYAVTGGFRRQLSAAWTADIGLNYGKNDPLGRAYGNAFSNAMGTIGVDRKLGDHLTAGVRYGRGSNSYTYASVSSYGNSANHNWAWITVAYHFSRPLGR